MNKRETEEAIQGLKTQVSRNSSNISEIGMSVGYQTNAYSGELEHPEISLRLQIKEICKFLGLKIEWVKKEYINTHVLKEKE